MKEHGENALGTSCVARPLEYGEVSGAARLHVRELGGEFLSRFGEGFMCRYYGAFVDSPYAVALCVPGRSGDGVEGIFLGAFDARAHYSYLVRSHGTGLAASAILAIVKSPVLLLDVLKTRVARYVRGIVRSFDKSFGRDRGKTEGAGDSPVGFAVYVAVEPGSRGRGIGRVLFEDFETRCRSFGVERIEAATRSGGEGEKFFHGIGWSREAVLSGEESYVIFSKHIPRDFP